MSNLNGLISENEFFEQRNLELANKTREQGVTLVTLCDMVLGADAADRSDTALIRKVGLALRVVETARQLKSIDDTAEYWKLKKALDEFDGARQDQIDAIADWEARRKK